MSYAIAQVIYGIDLSDLESQRSKFTVDELEAYENASEDFEDDYIHRPYSAGGDGSSAIGVELDGFDECDNTKVKDLVLAPTAAQIEEFEAMVDEVKSEYPELARLFEEEPEVFFLWGSS